MKKNISEIDLISKKPFQRKKIVENEINKIKNFSNIDEDFQKGKKFEKLLKMGLKVEDIICNKSPTSASIKKIFDEFEKKFLEYFNKKIINPDESIYTLSETPSLLKANSLTRSLSTKLGQVWEDIAFLSPKVINTEKIFNNLKITGVDLIIIGDKEFNFCQIKTKKDTLTGSQVKRSVNELEIYEKKMFVAALDLSRWTFNSSKVPRVAGKDFWDLIDIDYDEILKNIKNLLTSMEDYLKIDNINGVN